MNKDHEIDLIINQKAALLARDENEWRTATNKRKSNRLSPEIPTRNIRQKLITDYKNKSTR